MKTTTFLQKMQIASAILLLLTNQLIGAEEKFNMGGNDRTDKGPLFYIAIVGASAAFIALLIIKIKWDKKTRESISNEYKQRRMQPLIPGRLKHPPHRNLSSKTGGATS